MEMSMSWLRLTFASNSTPSPVTTQRYGQLWCESYTSFLVFVALLFVRLFAMLFATERTPTRRHAGWCTDPCSEF